LLGQVVPELALARLRRRESLLHVLRAQARRRPSAPALVFGEAKLDYDEL
jgi:hypothetical protein